MATTSRRKESYRESALALNAFLSFRFSADPFRRAGNVRPDAGGVPGLSRLVRLPGLSCRVNSFPRPAPGRAGGAPDSFLPVPHDCFPGISSRRNFTRKAGTGRISATAPAAAPAAAIFRNRSPFRLAGAAGETRGR